MIHILDRHIRSANKKNNKKILLLVMLTNILLLSSVLTALAEKTTEEQIRENGQTISDLRKQSEEAKKKLAEATEEKNLINKKLNELNGQLEEVQLALSDIEGRLDEKNEEIQMTADELLLMKATKQERYEAMKLRIRFMYEHSSDSMLDALFSSHSMSELLNRAEYFSQVVAYDRDQLVEYQELLEQVQAKQAAFEKQKEELVALLQEQQEQMDKLSAVVEQTRVELKDAGTIVASAEDAVDEIDDKLQQQLEYEAALEAQKAAEDKARLEEIRRQEEELQRALEEKRRQAALAEAERQRREEEERRRQEEAAAQSQQGQDQEIADSSVDNGDSDWQPATDDIPYVNPSEYTSQDLELMACIIQCEADGEPYAGKLAVGSVVMNRMYSSSFPSTIMGVIYQSGQFSPVASGRFAARLAAGPNETCVRAAREVLGGNITVPYLYFRVDNGTIDGYVLGHHVFY